MSKQIKKINFSLKEILLKELSQSKISMKHSAAIVDNKGKIISLGFNDDTGHAEANCLKQLTTKILKIPWYFLCG